MFVLILESHQIKIKYWKHIEKLCSTTIPMLVAPPTLPLRLMKLRTFWFRESEINRYSSFKITLCENYDQGSLCTPTTFHWVPPLYSSAQSAYSASTLVPATIPLPTEHTNASDTSSSERPQHLLWLWPDTSCTTARSAWELLGTPALVARCYRRGCTGQNSWRRCAGLVSCSLR